MADPTHGNAPDVHAHESEIWDGRFGERFDDEVSARAVTYTIVGTGLLPVIGIILMYVMYSVMVGSPDDRAPVVQQMAPPLPRLQADPEGELEAFRAQLEERLDSYGWVDEAAGIAHIPIDDAIAILAERGLPAVSMPPAAPSDQTVTGQETMSTAADADSEEAEP